MMINHRSESNLTINFQHYDLTPLIIHLFSDDLQQIVTKLYNFQKNSDPCIFD